MRASFICWRKKRLLCELKRVFALKEEKNLLCKLDSKFCLENPKISLLGASAIGVVKVISSSFKVVWCFSAKFVRSLVSVSGLVGYILCFRFIIEYSSLRGFWPLGNNNNNNRSNYFLYEDFWNMISWLVLKLEISIVIAL